MASTAEKDLLRKLKIMTGTASRLSKELQSYEKEAQKQQDRINKMKENNADPYDVKKQEEVLAETTHMIPDTKKRLTTAVSDLRDHLTLIGANLQSSEEWKNAQELLEKVDPLVQ